MTTTPPAYTPPLAKGYQPGVPTWLDKHAPRSSYDADEAIRRALRLAIETKSASDLTLERIKRIMGIEMEIRTENHLNNRSGWYWLTPNWLLVANYMPPEPPRREGTSFILKFQYDQTHWADMPDRAELCANRQMDVAAAEKILLDKGFVLKRKPDTRFNDRWAYYQEGAASVRIYSFGDGPLGNKHVCIRKIEVSI